MSNHHTHSHDSGPSNNGNSFVSRREQRANNMTGALPALGTLGIERSAPPASFDFEQMVLSLHELFANDRQIASQPDTTRCGICYLYFTVSELHYRDDGFYVCQGCAQTLGNQKLPMLHKQQKM